MGRIKFEIGRQEVIHLILSVPDFSSLFFYLNPLLFRELSTFFLKILNIFGHFLWVANFLRIFLECYMRHHFRVVEVCEEAFKLTFGSPMISCYPMLNNQNKDIQGSQVNMYLQPFNTLLTPFFDPILTRLLFTRIHSCKTAHRNVLLGGRR